MKRSNLISKTIHRALLAASALLLLSLAAPLYAQPAPAGATNATAAAEVVTIHSVRYEGTLGESDARFATSIEVESTAARERVLPLFSGNVAVLAAPGAFPDGLRLIRTGQEYHLVISKPGRYQAKFELAAKVSKLEPWRSASFTGPASAIAAITAKAAGGMEVQLLSGTTQPAADKSTVRGFLGADRLVSLRWQSKAAEEARKALLIAETAASVHVTPSVAKYTTQLRYEIVQGKLTNLTVALPSTQAIIKLQGEQIRDWRVKAENGRQTLTIDFIKPVEKNYALTLFTEQAIEGATAAIVPAQPLETERENGTLSVTAEDVLVETDTATGLRQMNAAAGAVAAWQFFGRQNLSLALKLLKIDPVVNLANRASVRLEESRLLVSHSLGLNVEKAGIYSLEFAPQTNFVVASVTGEGIEDWKAVGGKLTVNFARRVLGRRQIEVQLEQALKTFPESFTVTALRATGAVKETSQIGAAAAAGIQLKTGALIGAREVPVSNVGLRAGESLAYTAEQPDWSLKLGAEKLPARVTAEVFNLVTIGDGLLGGSATIRYGILNQGVQEFKVRVPLAWKNVEFTGPNIRRKESAAVGTNTISADWTVSLQEKAWGGYTLVITYDAQFDPHKATLPVGGVHVLGVDREAGAVAITSAANLELKPLKMESLRRVDEAELSANDRALIARPVLLAYQYEGAKYDLAVAVTRFTELPVLAAVADRTQLTTVLTEQGQMLTQASFMVKNNDKQFQRFTLPPGAAFWSAYVNNQPAKIEKEGDTYLVPLPRGANRNETIAVDLVYAQNTTPLDRRGITGFFPVKVALAAPTNDVPNTYNEWELYIPANQRLGAFDGNMIVARGTTYGWRDAWNECRAYYRRHASEFIALAAVLIALAVVLYGIITAVQRGWRAAAGVAVTALVLLVLSGMLLPTLSSYKYAASRTSGEVSNPTGLDLYDAAAGEGERLEAKVANGDRMDRFERLPDANSPAERPADRQQQLGQKGEPMRESDQPSSSGTASRVSPAKKSPPPLPQAQAATPGSQPPMSGPGTSVTGGALAAVVVPSNQQPSQPQGGMGTVRGVDDRAGGGGSAGWGSVAGGDKGEGAAMAAGIRPIRVEIPRSGQRIVFTKALNVNREPLRIEALAMETQKFSILRALAQVAAFLAGLFLLWKQYQQVHRDTFRITGGLALVLGSIAYFLLSQRLLGDALIALPLLLTAAVVLWQVTRLITKLWHNRKKSPPTAPPSAETPVIPAAVVLALGFFIVQTAVAQPVALPALARPIEIIVLPETPLEVPGGPRVIRELQLQDRNGTKFEINQEVSYTGKVVGFFENKQRRFEANYKDGKSEGIETHWFDNGQKAREAGYKLGLADGVTATWFRNGQKSEEIAFAAGKRHGASRAWHASGKPEREMTYLTGEPHGLARFWHVNGKPSKEVLWHEGRQLSFELFDDRGVAVGSVTNAITLLTATYTAAVREQVAEVEADFDFTALKAGQRFPLFGDDVAVESFTSTAKDAKLLREGRGLVLWLAEAGAAKVKVKFHTRLTGDAAKRQLSFAIPPALTSTLAITLNEPEAVVDLPTAVTFKTTPAAQQTRVDGTIGAADHLELAWTPRVKKAEETSATVFVQNAVLVSFEGGVIRSRATLDYQITQGELRSARIRLPVGQKLMRVEGDHVRTWRSADEKGENILTVELAKGVATAWRVFLDLEQPLAVPPAVVKVAVPQALDVKRETGFIGIKTSDDLSFVADTTSDLQKVDTSEFTRAVALPDVATTAWRFLKPGIVLAGRVEAVQPQIEAVAHHHLRITTDQLLSSSQIDYTIKRVGVFTLRQLLPAGYRVERVIGDRLAQWVEKTEGTNRIVEVTLTERMLGHYPLRVDLALLIKEVPKSVSAVGAHPIGVQKLTGFVAVSAEEGVQVKTENFDGLTEIPVSALPAAPIAQNTAPIAQSKQQMMSLPIAGTLAFKFITGEPTAQPAWKLSVATERIDSWVRAEIATVLTVQDTLVSGRAIVKYEIANAPTKEFQLRIPAGFKNVEINCSDIRRRDQQGDLWRVELQNKKRGTYTITVTWEQPFDATKGEAFKVLPIVAQGVDPKVERETGMLIFNARAPLQVAEDKAGTDLIPIDSREVPEWAGVATDTATLAYRYLRPGYELAVRARRHDPAEVLQALVDSASLVSVITEDGQMMTQMTLNVRNNGRQFLELTLPDKQTEVWSAFVAGQPVRPTNRGGKLLLPLERSGEGATIPIDITFIGRVQFPERNGKVALAAPTLNVPLKNARWDLFLPPGYDYAKFEGTMSREARRAAQVVRVFSQTDYSQVEDENRAKRRSDVTSSINFVQENLKKGNIEEANKALSQTYRANNDLDLGKNNEEVKKLEKDIRKAQARNLVDAQNTYSFNLRQRLATEQGQQSLQLDEELSREKASGKPFVLYDNETAEQQLAMVHKAQEVTSSKVSPLRVNLPQRGLQFGFAQALQTETGKAMTITFAAANLETPGVFNRVLWGSFYVALLAFLVALGRRALSKES